MLRFPLGYVVFKEIVDGNFDFVDKTIFIKDIFDDNSKVILITRPRRFGKTLNLSMLHHFLAEEVVGQKTAGLFDKYKIKTIDDGAYMQHQGQYPTIFITFKDVKDHNFEHAYSQLVELIVHVHDQP